MAHHTLLIDADYVERVAFDLIVNFERMLGRRIPPAPLADWLDEHDVKDVDIVGIATDFCVLATAKDAVDAGYETRVLIDLTAPVHEDKLDDVIADMEDDGITVTEAL